MLEMEETIVPRTTADIVFDRLQDEIGSLTLLPGTKMSEAEVAARMGVSRQPVRDAFNRLSHLDLLSIRPQRATVVRGFSAQKIANARFIRLSIELEVLRSAKAKWNDAKASALAANLDIQRQTLAAGQTNEFHALDYEFHKLIFDLSDHSLAFETVMKCKQQVDRLCMLGLKRPEEAVHIFEDHEQIAGALSEGPMKNLETVLRRHLSRLDATIGEIQETHADYFE